MRVVHLGKYYPPASGGIENHTRTLAQAQATLGAEVEVVVVNHATPTGLDVTFDTFGRTRPSTESDGPVTVRRAGRWASVARFDLAPGLNGILRELLHRPPDVWHLHTPNVTMTLAVLAHARIRPLVVTHHSDIIRQRVLRYFIRPLERAICRRASAILTTSPPYAEGSELLAGFPAKVQALPLGIDLTPFQKPSPAALAHADSVRRAHPGPIWVSVGRLVYYKALDVALAALREVPGTFIVIGTGPMEPAWKEAAVRLGVADRVVWRGRASDDELIGTYRAATALWFPSNARSEGFGLVQVEAMASGCPVINAAIPHSGVPWVSRHEETALTVPANNPAAFAAASRRLLDEPGLRQRLTAAGRTQAVDRFDHRVMAKRSLAIYEATIRQP